MSNPDFETIRTPLEVEAVPQLSEMSPLRRTITALGVGALLTAAAVFGTLAYGEAHGEPVNNHPTTDVDYSGTTGS